MRLCCSLFNSLTPNVEYGTAIKHPVPDLVKPCVRVLGCQKLQDRVKDNESDYQ